MSLDSYNIVYWAPHLLASEFLQKCIQGDIWVSYWKWPNNSVPLFAWYDIPPMQSFLFPSSSENFQNKWFTSEHIFDVLCDEILSYLLSTANEEATLQQIKAEFNGLKDAKFKDFNFDFLDEKYSVIQKNDWFQLAEPLTKELTSRYYKITATVSPDFAGFVIPTQEAVLSWESVKIYAHAIRDNKVISTFTDNGVSVAAAIGKANFTYTLSNVVANHDIKITYKNK